MIKPPARAVKTTPQAFEKLRAAVRNDPGAAVQAVNAANSQAGNNKPILRLTRGKEIQNPIELPGQ